MWRPTASLLIRAGMLGMIVAYLGAGVAAAQTNDILNPPATGLADPSLRERANLVPGSLWIPVDPRDTVRGTDGSVRGFSDPQRTGRSVIRAPNGEAIGTIERSRTGRGIARGTDGRVLDGRSARSSNSGRSAKSAIGRSSSKSAVGRSSSKSALGRR